MKLKYVVDELGEFAIFSEYVKHSDVANQFRHTEIVGAGFVEIFDGEVTCYGESTSLKIKSRGEKDATLIAHKFNLNVGEHSVIKIHV